MANVVPINGGQPEFSVFVETSGRLNLSNVASFLQRLDTGTRRVATNSGAPATVVQVVALATGSLDIKLKLQTVKLAKATVLLGAGTLALGVANYLKEDPAAARSCRALIEGDNATVIIVKGGGTEHRVTSNDLAPDYREAARRVGSAGPREPMYEVLTGPQTGFIRNFGGQNWVELTDRPGLMMLVRDERRGDQKGLEQNARYTLEGEAHISPPGRPSYFVLRHAIRL